MRIIHDRQKSSIRSSSSASHRSRTSKRIAMTSDIKKQFTIKASKSKVACASGQEVLENGWVIQKIGRKWYFMSPTEYERYADHLEDFPKDRMVDSYPSKKALIDDFKREQYYSDMFASNRISASTDADNPTEQELEEFAESVVNDLETDYSEELSQTAWMQIYDTIGELVRHPEWYTKTGSTAKMWLENTICDIYEEDTGLEHVYMSCDSANKSITASDSDKVSNEDVRELSLYIVNEESLNNLAQSIIKNMQRKIKQGIYDDELAVKAWQRLADDGVRAYDKAYGSGKGELFLNKATRTAIAKELRESYDEEVHEVEACETPVSAAIYTNPGTNRTPVESNLEYYQALADGVVALLDKHLNDGDVYNIRAEVTQEAITFLDDDNNIYWIQSGKDIVPNWDDLNDDIDELYQVVYLHSIPQF